MQVDLKLTEVQYYHSLICLSKNIKTNIKRTLTNYNEYNPILVRMANPAKCDRGITLRSHMGMCPVLTPPPLFLRQFFSSGDQIGYRDTKLDK